LDSLGPIEDKVPPLTSELNNPAIEPIARRYDEIRYQLLSYNYTLAWQARETGLPFMRALWLHYPQDIQASKLGNQYLWGRDLLVAPVFEKAATSREVYLPDGEWYDWWTGERQSGGRSVTRKVDLATMPIYVRAGAILPVDPIRQHTEEKVHAPLTIRVYQGADGDYAMYEDDGKSLGYLKGDFILTKFHWDDAGAVLDIQRSKPEALSLRIELLPAGRVKAVEITDQPVKVDFSKD
jgi:alpha-glucosidase (family GH31 glycosyl hydrolase)